MELCKSSTDPPVKVGALDVAPDGTLHFAGSVSGRARSLGRAGSLDFAVEFVDSASKEAWAVAAAHRSAQVALGSSDGLVDLINYVYVSCVCVTVVTCSVYR